MIEISPTTALMLYLGVTLISILGLWSFQHYSQRKRKAPPSKERLVACEYCGFPYLSSSDRPVSQCPQCASFNA